MLVTANDTAGAGSELVTNTLSLSCAGVDDCVLSEGVATVSGQGAFSINSVDGTVVFDPSSDFSGTAPAITYNVWDVTGQRATSTYTPTVEPLPTQVVSPTPEPSVVANPLPSPTVPADSPRPAVGAVQRDAPANVYVPLKVRPVQTFTAVKSSKSFASIRRDAGLSASKKQTVKITVSKSSKKVCRVSGKSVKTLRPGTCNLQIKILPKSKFKKEIAPVKKAWVLKVS
jgi:CshA-type fibril repeat protein